MELILGQCVGMVELLGVGGELVAVRWKGMEGTGVALPSKWGGVAGGVKGGFAKGVLGEGVEMMVIAVWCVWSVGGCDWGMRRRG